MTSIRWDLRLPFLLLAATLAVFVWSAIGPYERLTWWLEVFPVIAAVAILITTHRRFPLTTMAYALVFIHVLILLVGGHYTYARVPIGLWIQSTAGLARNHFDRLGHFAQGFVPAILAREVLLRTSPLKPGKWMAFIVISIALAISAAYELLEWGSAIVLGSGAEDFLATQGDPWDTQKDMGMALIGAVTALGLLSRLHDRQLTSLSARNL